VHAAPTAVRQVRVSVDNTHCHLYAICQQEAPAVFDLGVDGRLRYTARPDAAESARVEQAARCCPMQAITVETR
jgi:ferredoxin